MVVLVTTPIPQLHFYCNQLIQVLSQYCCCIAEICGSADQSAAGPAPATTQELAVLAVSC